MTPRGGDFLDSGSSKKRRIQKTIAGENLALALRAKMSSAACFDYSFDWCFTPSTWQSGAQVNAVFELKKTAYTLGVYVV